MATGPQFKVKHSSGRILGPLDLARIRLLILKNQISGTELARAYPEGNWKDINLYPEISNLLLQHAKGTLEKETKNTLSSNQSSYRPILGSQSFDPMAATVVLTENIIPEPTPVLPPTEHPRTEKKTDKKADKKEEKKKEPLVATKKPEPKTPEQNLHEIEASNEPALQVENSPTPSKSEPEDDKTVIAEKNDAIELEQEEPTEMQDFLAKRIVSSSKQKLQSILPAINGVLNRGISREPTVMIDRSTGKRKFRAPSKKELIRVLIIAGALGYFGYDSFLKQDEPDIVFRKKENFRPKLPIVESARVNPQLSQKLYGEGMKMYVIDNVLAYKGAAAKLYLAANADPENVKALAMLASCYINLIDSSNKDENYFATISKLIEMSKAKNVDLPETVISDVEFLIITNRGDAAVNRIVEYTKSNPKFDNSMFFYLSLAFASKGDFQNAAKYMSFFPDNKAFSPRIFYLRGQIAEGLKNPTDARAEYQKALKMNATHAASRLRLVALNVREGRFKESTKDIEVLVSNPELLSPKDLAESYYYYAMLFQTQENWDAAFSALERAVRLDRNNHDYLLEYYTLKARTGNLVASAKKEAQMYSYLGEGEKMLKQGNTHEALTQFLQARDANPDSIVPLIKIGDMFVHLNDMVNARLNYKKAADRSPNSIDIWSKYIHVLIQSYEWEEATKAMDKFRKLPVSQSAIDKAAGDMYAKQNRHPEAQTFYKKAMLRESIDPDVYIAYAKSLMATKNFKDAPFFFALAQRFDPLSVEAVIGTAKAVANSESIEAGIRMLQDELKKGGIPAAELHAGIAELLIQKGEWAAAQSSVDEARRVDPDNATAWKLQAQIHLNQEGADKKALDRALDAYKSYSDRNTSDPSGYLERYRIFVRKAQFEKANEELDRIYAIYPKYPNLHFYKGAMYGVMGNHKVAAQEYLSELENNPNSVPTLISLGKELLELGDAKSAIQYLTKAMQFAPTNSEAKFQAANANKVLRNYQGAVALYQEALRLDSGNPLIYKKLGECYRDMGDAINAGAAFRKYLEMEPDAQDRSEFERYL